MSEDLERRLLAAALAYARRGWAVLPLREADKAPDGRLAPRGLHDASRDEMTITRWWRASPRANVGLRTGDPIDVVDLDGPRSLLEGRHPPVVPGAVVATGRGWHYYFAASGLPSRAGVIPGVNVRGVGGYVVAPPSLHPSGARYGFVDPLTGAARPLPPPGHLPRVPIWLVELCQRRDLPRPTADAGPVRVDASAYARAALAGECAAVAATPEGSRNDRLNRAAFAAGTLVGAGALPAEQATELLLGAAVRAGLSEAEARRTITSGLGAGRERPRQLTGGLAPARAREPPAGEAPVIEHRRPGPEHGASVRRHVRRR